MTKENLDNPLCNYQLIKDEESLLNFIEWLPELKSDETYYLSLLARNKYNKDFPANTVQLKRVIANKQMMFNKIKQMECQIGSYQYKGQPIPEDTLCLYITPNPRSQTKATKKLLKNLLDLALNNYSGYNIQSEALSAIQISSSRTVYMDFDFDDIEIEDIKPLLNGIINEDAVTFVKTYGGFHLLIEVAKIAKEYFKSYYDAILRLPNCDVRKDNLLPIPGCIQGNKVPQLIKN